MRKLFKLFGLLISMLILLTLASCASNQNNQTNTQSQTNKLVVYTSFYPMYDFAQKIGGDKISLTNMVPAGTEPHDWEPTAKDVANLEKANVFIYNGADMESWVSQVLSSLQNKDLQVVEASRGIKLIGESGASVKTYDPHVWLNPLNAKQEMANIEAAFIKADPKNKAYYQANYEKYAAEFKALDAEFKGTLSKVTNKNIIVAHQAFGYLCQAYGLNQVAIEGLAADSEPEPARMSEIIKFAKANKVKYIFFEELVSPKVAQTIAKATGAQTKVLNPIEGLTDAQIKAGNDYFTVMRQNLQILKEALS